MARFGKWFAHGANAATYWTLLPAGVVGVITAILSQGVAAIRIYGAFGWWTAGLAGFLAFSVILALAGSAWQKFSLARATSKWARETDDINPLEPEFTRRRIRLQDLAHPETGRIKGKRIVACELLGHVNFVAYRKCIFQSCQFMNCDIVVMKDETFVRNTLVMEDCTLLDSELWNCTIFTSQELYDRELKPLGMNLVTYERPAHDVAESV